LTRADELSSFKALWKACQDVNTLKRAERDPPADAGAGSLENMVGQLQLEQTAFALWSCQVWGWDIYI